MDWIDTDKELPPCDGEYEVTNDIKTLMDLSVMNYDGIGFFYLYGYYPVKYWRHRKKPEKKYGKIEE